jgi:hypothetical protein
MERYKIADASATAEREVQILLEGPGLDPSGRRYIFATTARCKAFVEALNLAYEQGVRDGMSQAPGSRKRDAADNRLLLVTGRTPDEVGLRSESWLRHLQRSWLHRRRKS